MSLNLRFLFLYNGNLKNIRRSWKRHTFVCLPSVDPVSLLNVSLPRTYVSVEQRADDSANMDILESHGGLPVRTVSHKGPTGCVSRYFKKKSQRMTCNTEVFEMPISTSR